MCFNNFARIAQGAEFLVRPAVLHSAPQNPPPERSTLVRRRPIEWSAPAHATRAEHGHGRVGRLGLQASTKLDLTRPGRLILRERPLKRSNRGNEACPPVERGVAE